MRNVFRIYRRDLKNIFTNWVALVVTLALVILPPMYAWFNIKAAWDPYGNTKGIKVAVVNEDKGGTFNDKEYKLGDKIIESLKENDAIGWQFVSAEKAEKGVRNGTYYASIVIPENFSKNILSITNNNIEKPVLKYTVNEKTNAIAPKITDKGVTSIQQQVSGEIVETVDGIIFKIINSVGLEIQNAKPDLRKIIDKLYEIDDKLPEINDLLNKAKDGTITLQEVVKKLNEIMPTVETTIDDSQELVTNFKGFLEKGNTVLNDIAPTIKDDLVIVNGITSNISDLVNSIDTNMTNEQRVNLLTSIQTKLQNLNIEIGNLNDFITNINKVLKNQKLTELSQKLIQIQDMISNQVTLVQGAIDNINAGKDVATSTFEDIKKVANDINTVVSAINDSFDTEIVPVIQGAISSLNGISDNALTILNEVEGSIPDVKKIVSLLGEGADLGEEKLTEIINNFPAMKEKVDDFVGKIRQIDDDKLIDGILGLMINNWQANSSYLASPVEVETESIFPLPNYGAGMNPFFSTLALWVGALLLVSMYTTKAHKLDDDKEIKPLEEYFGKYLTFLSIGLAQGLVTTLGDLFILKTYVIHKALFVFYAMFISIVFITIVYTLVSVLGNVGKAIGVVFLVLQISASGGTFPVEVMPKFFQVIHPMLPFKYAIGGMREAVAGIVPELLIKDTLMLIGYMLVFLILGILLKAFANKVLVGFDKKMEDSGLMGH